nr:unnamed protein product [Spirometra erinaceieuropaei]
MSSAASETITYRPLSLDLIDLAKVPTSPSLSCSPPYACSTPTTTSSPPEPIEKRPLLGCLPAQQRRRRRRPSRAAISSFSTSAVLQHQGNCSSMMKTEASEMTRPIEAVLQTADGHVGTPPRLIEQSQPPDCLVLLQIATAGSQGADLGSDEMPPVLITAKLLDVQEKTLSGPEFQVLARLRRNRLSRDLSEDYPDLTDETSVDGCWPPGGEPTVTSKTSTVPAGASTATTSMDISTDCESPFQHLSEECRTFTGLSLADLEDAPTLAEALQELDNWIMGQGLYYVADFSESIHEACTERNYTEKSTGGVEDVDYRVESASANVVSSTEQYPLSRKRRFEVVTDGVLTLRMVLHQNLSAPVARTTALYPYLYRFIDLKKQFRLFYPKLQSSLSLPEMMRDLGLPKPEFPRGFVPEMAVWPSSWVSELSRDHHLLEAEARNSNGEVSSCSTRMDYPDDGTRTKLKPGYWPMEYCRNMAKLCLKMTSDGVEWRFYECIFAYYQPGIVKVTDHVEDDVVVRARGLPWQATDSDIQFFFRGLNIAPGGIALVLNKFGRRNGEALIRFTDREQRDLALRKHKHHMNQRYIEIYMAQGSDFIAVAGGETEEAEKFLQKFTEPSQALIRMRGLPYTVTAEQILEFFSNANCEVQFGEEGVLFVNRHDGRATGDAFALFADDREAQKALKNHRQHIGNRYIELFRSTPAEVNQVMNVVLNPNLGLPQNLCSPFLDMEAALQAAATAGLACAGSPNNGTNKPSISPLVNQGLFLPGSALFSTPGAPLLFNQLQDAHQRSHVQQQQQQQHLTPAGAPNTAGQYSPLLNWNNGLLQNPLIAAGAPAAPISLLGAPNMLPPHLRMFYLPEMAQVAWNPLDLLVKSRIPASTAAAAAGGGSGSAAGSGATRNPRTLVHLRGMPVEATVNDILNYLGVYWQFVALHGIHLVYTAAGEPSGEAFVHFVSEIAASLVVLGKQNQSFVTASGARSNVQLILTTQEETNEFVSIPGTQPSINWSALASSLNSGGGGGVSNANTTTTTSPLAPTLPYILPSGIPAPLLLGLQFPFSLVNQMSCMPTLNIPQSPDLIGRLNGNGAKLRLSNFVNIFRRKHVLEEIYEAFQISPSSK